MARLVRRLFAPLLETPRRTRTWRQVSDLRVHLWLSPLESRTVPANITVLNTADSGTGSLRQAIADSNTSVGIADTIVFDSTAFASPSTISLTSGELAVTDSVTITGTGANNLTVRRDPSAGGFFRVFNVSGPGTLNVTLSGMTISGGNSSGPAGVGAAGDGGGIFIADENLTLLNSTVSGNVTSTEGGGIALGPNGGALVVRDSTISGNTATGVFTSTNGGGSGGGIYIAYGGDLLVENSTISGNATPNSVGGGVYMYGFASRASNWTIRNTTISNNASGLGGGFSCLAGDADILVVENSTLSGNTSGGGGGGGFFYGSAASSMTIRNSTLSGNVANEGGGLFFYSGLTLVVENSTVSGNAVNIWGGGIYFKGDTIRVQNTTISGNTANGVNGAGGGIAFSGSTLIMQNSTVTNNRANGTNALFGGGGLFQPAASTNPMTIVSSIVSGNTNSNGPDILSNGPVTANFSALGSPTGFTLSGTSSNNLSFGAALNLQPLANNGGLTQTVALGSGSAAIDVGANPMGLTTDQRGSGFVRSNGVTDIGAFEVQSSTATAPRVTGVQTNTGTQQRSMVTSIQVTFNTVVTFAGPVASAFTLSRIVDGATVSFTAVATTVGGVTVVTLSGFSGTAATVVGSLADGRYTLTAVASQITANGLQLDGNGDGTGGDNFTFADSGSTSGNQLYRLFGDGDGNRVVNALDLTLFRAAFGANTSDITFDVDLNGVINQTDLIAFRTNFGATP